MVTRQLIATIALILVLPLAAEERKADTAALVKGNTAFALDLYAKLRTQDGNLFLSPYSISTALGMTYAGARGTTATQMEKALHFPYSGDKLSPAFRELIDQGRAGKGYQLNVANALWCQVNYPFLDSYLGVVEKDYHAALKAVNFSGATEEARQTINAWVEKQTKDKIKELIETGVVNPDTRLVLTNAIYFKGDWASKFKKDATKDEPFLTGSNPVKVPMMQQKARFGYLDGGTFQALEMPYAGKELSMVIFLPKKADGLADFEQSLTAHKLTGWLGKLQQREVNVALPRFKMTSEFRLDQTLMALGMSDAFDLLVADLSGINGKKGLFIGAAVHQAFVEVNEEGTEAAAATAVGIQATSLQLPVQFKADHPFFFVIRDYRTGSILFMGRLLNPAG
jgi:serpin B